MPVEEAIRAFLLAFPALFSIINPISGAFIFREVTAGRSVEARHRLARQVAIYAFVVMMVALWAGTHLLQFFGVSLAALRIAGGLVVALSAWGLLNAPEVREARKQKEAAPSEGVEDVALFPLTIPFTTGPGTMAVAVALGSGHSHGLVSMVRFIVGTSLAALAMAVVIWLFYHFAERLVAMVGPSGSRTLSRLFAFLLLCIGVQILITGVEDVLGPLFRPA
jgi:multiple antibiotic resistance protein